MDRTAVPVVHRVVDAHAQRHAQENRMTKMLDATSFLVLGESLGAGMTNFSVSEGDQRESFPAQMARQMKVEFRQPLVQAPGLGDAHGFPRLPVRIPFDHQTTVLEDFPPSAPISNLSVPGLTVADAVARRPVPPLIHSGDAQQTAINFILGMPGLLRGDASLPTALEYALERKPTFAIVELGYAEVLEAAISGSAGSIPDAAAFRANYARIVKALRDAGCEVVAMTIPDPMDTAHFSSAAAAARVVKLPPKVLGREYGLASGARVTVNGLTEIGYQLMSGRSGPLPAGSVLRATAAAEISSRVQSLNAALTSVAVEHGAIVYDLGGLFRRVGKEGIAVGSRTLTADFLGGFYSLNGYSPGKTGQALIANELLDLINRTYDTAFEPIDVGTTIQSDAVAMYQGAEGPEYRTLAGYVASAFATLKVWSTMAGFLVNMVVGAIFRKRPATPPSSGSTPERWTLKLPPDLEQELPLNKAASYYGDALRAVHTTDKAEVEYGLTGQLLFGGLAMLDTHLGGSVRITFSPPVNDVSHFEVTHGNGLAGDDSRLSAPQFFKLPAIEHRVMDSAAERSSGDLNLVTGEVTNLQYKFFFLNSAILSLAAVNPALPRDPLKFPGEYGSTWAKFEQRPDGKLDYTCYATTFIPLSVLNVPIRFPLPFTGPSGSFASIPADGTALHPHIRISTKAPEAADAGVLVPEFPTNAIREFTTSVHNNSFGDDFSLNAPELGGHTKGRSHLVGRFQVQFGERFGDSVPIAIQAMPPGGLLRTLQQSSFADAFKHRIPDGLMGHNEMLRFPKSTYVMDSVTYLDDPLDISLGVVDVKTGKVPGPLLRRGLITTNWLLAMVRIETRTPKATFAFRGPASFEKGVNGQMVFRYHGKLHIPFPEGFKFPATDLTNYILIGPDSALDPFLRWQAMSISDAPRLARAGSAKGVVASTGDEFSYSYRLPAGDGQASFEYVNHTKDATFRMQGLLWAGFINSRTAAPGDYDTLSFGGIGTWSKDPGDQSHIATVQVSTSAKFPYVTIMVDGGRTSSVNTKPANVDDTMP
ncbi:MAG: hypothetical protein A3H97_09495 [Acidobacteria bacterium RIFCSPLOWO2_02_FULL_65_29]|nr:MAG: hypothetical protein A3H97_09495 [Acidobacteria bacterium RIFCSPLOWO2_02_FULL_65_29]